MAELIWRVNPAASTSMAWGKGHSSSQTAAPRCKRWQHHRAGEAPNAAQLGTSAQAIPYRPQQPKSLRRSYWGQSHAKKDFAFCSSWSLEWVAPLMGLLHLQHWGSCILPLLWERCNSAETSQSNRGHQEPRGLSSHLRYHKKSQQWSCRDSHSLQSPTHHKSSPYFPSAKVCWLCCLPMPEPVFFAAYLKLGNPQELRAREAICQEPSALMGIFFFTRDFWFSCCFCFQTLGCLLAVGVCWNQNWRKTHGIHPGEQKGFCTGGFGRRGCFHCCYLHFCFLPAKEHLPAVPEEGDTWPGDRHLLCPQVNAFQMFMHRGTQDAPEPAGQASLPVLRLLFFFLALIHQDFTSKCHSE